MFFSIDRIVEGRAVLEGEDRLLQEVPAELLPPGACEGDVLWRGEDGFHPAPEETKARRARLSGMLGQLLGTHGKGEP